MIDFRVTTLLTFVTINPSDLAIFQAKAAQIIHACDDALNLNLPVKYLAEEEITKWLKIKILTKSRKYHYLFVSLVLFKEQCTAVRFSLNKLYPHPKI